MKSSMRLLSRIRIPIRLSSRTSTISRPSLTIPLSQTQRTLRSQTYRLFSSSQPTYKGLQPDSADPKAPATEPHTAAPTEATELSPEEYHSISEEYINHLVHRLEVLAEASKDIDVEYSAGVLTLSNPSGTYIINKQPPNKQIWLSSPISGPKRYDWVVAHDGQHQKEGTETEDHDHETGGKWTYLRDGSTLSELLEKEVGVDLGVEVGKGDSDGLVSGLEGRAGGGVSE